MWIGMIECCIGMKVIAKNSHSLTAVWNLNWTEWGTKFIVTCCTHRKTIPGLRPKYWDKSQRYQAGNPILRAFRNNSGNKSYSWSLLLSPDVRPKNRSNLENTMTHLTYQETLAQVNLLVYVVTLQFTLFSSLNQNEIKLHSFIQIQIVLELKQQKKMKTIPSSLAARGAKGIWSWSFNLLVDLQ